MQIFVLLYLTNFRLAESKYFFHLTPSHSSYATCHRMCFVCDTLAVRLECAIKSYQWGKIGSESKVAQFAKAGAQEFTIEEGNTYAEVSLSHITLCIRIFPTFFSYRL